MTSAAVSSGPALPAAGARHAVTAYVAIVAVVLVLLMAFGLTMRLAQAGSLAVPPGLFYQLLTAHGIGMVAIAGLGGATIMWHFLGRHVALSTAVFVANLVLFLVGVACVLGAIFLGGFAGAWTFLYPLPGQSMGLWSAHAAAVYMIGVLLVGVGFLLLFLDVARAILRRYGSFARALGWPYLFGGDAADVPPATVVASTVVTIANLLAIVVGAAILVMMTINLYAPGFAIDALLAKNMIFFFGHVFINAAIYMAVIAVYEVLPLAAGRPWKVSRPFLAAWTATLVMVLAVFPHHLLMDFAQPTWTQILGQVMSYTSSLPVLAVTAVGTLGLIHRSGIKWSLSSALLVLAIAGWTAGTIPAVVDGTIVVNRVMHNTLWVPGHFHFYLLIGLVAMVLGFMAHLGERDAARLGGLDRATFWVFVVSSLGFVMTFLASGKDGVPRRYAVHLPEWLPYDRVGSWFAAAVAASTLVFVLMQLRRLWQAPAA